MDNRTKWITMNEYVDKETGEFITEKTKNKDYITINKTKKVIINGNYGYITYTNECERNRQTRLF